jgi:malate dehydrogenase
VPRKDPNHICSNQPTSRFIQQINAGICATLAESIAEACPKAFILVISNPVNSTVPVFAEVLKKKGVFDPKR